MLSSRDALARSDGLPPLDARMLGWLRRPQAAMEKNRDAPASVVRDGQTWLFRSGRRRAKQCDRKRPGLRSIIPRRIVERPVAFPKEDGQIA